jgi:hypothetical protein
MGNVKIKDRDKKTLLRFETVRKASDILRNFFDKGFKSFDAFKAIVQNYHPEVTEKILFDFWHIRTFDLEMVEILEDVFEKLKIE